MTRSVLIVAAAGLAWAGASSAATATPLSALALKTSPRVQAFSEQDLYRQRLGDYTARIRDRETLGNTYDPALGETLQGMAKTLVQAGEFERARDVYQRAMHISRVNHGIYSLNQEPMLRGLVGVYEAVGDYQSAAQEYQRLYGLYAETYGHTDPRVIPVLEEISEWHLRAYVANPSREGLYHLVSSHNLAEAALTLSSSENETRKIRLIPLLSNMATVNYLLALYGKEHPGGSESFQFTTSTAGDFPAPPSREESLIYNSYRNGLNAHAKIAEIMAENPEYSPRERAMATAKVGDWHLLFGRHMSAREAYEHGWDIMAESGATDEELNAAFGQPFMISPLAKLQPADPPVESQEFVRVRMTITERGNARDIELVEEEKEPPRYALRHLRNSKFRPRLENGEVIRAENVPVKLYLAEVE